ncbi:AGR318Cp [Eremothecium gossypii ATCC 10895]|uniref:Crh-like protein n=1 Tax=Eremothecium gossypii (strain ATCC 10895 / CBS 109.51 / FGSC 9923 / NRRL Y-1056) TaxID=284811 RepID=Q74Z85_EREGS|nr:AGR318Cp [Eremothecium gossypii ATCC 10895]AAS54808.1 AGR318Cp [Eremothecium gossypii ATCC 10895]AEY99140.1 FAGR318Cp [Eremothecium gossypii FDAG1]
MHVPLGLLVAMSWCAGSAATAVQMCNPLKEKKCPENIALAASILEEFKDVPPGFSNYTDTGIVGYGPNGASFTLAKRWDNPAIMSDFYLMYGKVEVTFKAAPGKGIVSSFYLQSDARDEIDLEWLGGDTAQFQTNFFCKGNVTTYTRGAFHNVSRPQEEFHTYTIDWKMDELVFYLDGKPIRRVKNDTSEGYPQSPMRLYMGVWAGGDPTNHPGTVEWAGGQTDYSKVPFTAYIKRIIASDYSSGRSYMYSDVSEKGVTIHSTQGKIYGRYDTAQEEFNRIQREEKLDYSDLPLSAFSPNLASGSSEATSVTSSATSVTSSATSVTSSAGSVTSGVTSSATTGVSSATATGNSTSGTQVSSSARASSDHSLAATLLSSGHSTSQLSSTTSLTPSKSTTPVLTSRGTVETTPSSTVTPDASSIASFPVSENGAKRSYMPLTYVAALGILSLMG